MRSCSACAFQVGPAVFNPGFRLSLRSGLGFQIPSIPLEMGAPWATTGHWAYRDANECRQALNDAMDVIAIVLMPFADKMLEALS